MPTIDDAAQQNNQNVERFRLMCWARARLWREGEYAAATGVDGVGLDTSMGFEVASRSIPSGVAMQGNLDPLALVAGGAALRRESTAILAAMKGRPAIFNLGHLTIIGSTLTGNRAIGVGIPPGSGGTGSGGTGGGGGVTAAASSAAEIAGASGPAG